YTWDEFREQLIAEITAADARGSHASYYERFITALENLLTIKSVCDPDEIERQARIAAQTDDDD
ncbi:MAG TPA: hypothetical protein VHY56_01655, partial [Candidatus Binataceae bacterium]|nr:hypothetical protein [Candidatus Binataceae bacterium]